MANIEITLSSNRVFTRSTVSLAEWDVEHMSSGSLLSMFFFLNIVGHCPVTVGYFYALNTLFEQKYVYDEMPNNTE